MSVGRGDRIMRSGVLVLVVTVVGLTAGLTARLARADADVIGTITTSDPAGTPVAGAFVVLTGDGGQKYATVTDATGAYVVTAAESGTYAQVAQAPGQQVGKATGLLVDATPVTRNLALTASGATFEALGVYGGQIAGIAGDGEPGVFYASTSVIPQVYRTADWGGTWTQVTLAVDDADDGLAGGNSAGGLATSGAAGEVTVFVNGTVYASTDFGVTWRAVGPPPGGLPGGPSATLLWGHAGATNVLLLVGASQTFRADMSAATPTFAAQATSYLSDPNDRVTLSTGADGGWVAVVRATGTVEIYDLAENPPATVVSSVSGMPAPPTFVRLGGAKSAGVPPDALLVYAESGGDEARMATKSGGTMWTSLSAATSLPAGPGGCGQGPGAVGAVAPHSTGTDGNATLSQCFVTKSGAGNLTFATIAGVNNNTGLVFDAAYDRSIDFVILSGDGNRGLVKSAQEVAGVPAFPTLADAQPGTDALSGGVSVNGFNVPVIKDQTFGPGGAAQVGVIFSGLGGGLAVASDDGGVAFPTVVKKGGTAVAWWQGTSHTWLAFGHGGAGDLLSAHADWTSAATALPGPNVFGTSAAVLGPGGSPGAFTVSALAGTPGGDTVFVGGATDADGASGDGSVYRGALAGSGASVSFGSGTMIAGNSVGGSAVTAPVRALVYCPGAGSDATLQDVLLVAAGDDGGGTVVRITSATGASPTETVVQTGARMNDVRAHCASGRVYVGSGSNAGGPSGALYASTDGGQTFATVALAGPGVPPNLNVQVVAVSPDDPDQVLIAGNGEGYVLLSTTGGTSWTVVNDPQAPGGRNFLSEGVGDLDIPPAALPLRTGSTPAITGMRTLVGTGGGLFAADLTAAGVTCTSAAECADTDPCTTDTCTTDTCTAGTCQHPEPATVQSLRCELNEASGLTACADPKTKKFTAKALAKLTRLADKIPTASAKKLTKLEKTIAKALTALTRKIGKAKKTETACKTQLQDQLGAIQTLFTQL